MPRIATLDLALTPEARAIISTFLSSITDYAPTLCLTKSRTDNEQQEGWTIGAYGPKNIEVVAPELERLGHSLLYSFDGLVAAIPQFHLIHELKGKTLALAGRYLAVTERGDGI